MDCLSYKRIVMDASTNASKTTSQQQYNTAPSDFISFVFYFQYFPSSPSLFFFIILLSLLPSFHPSFLQSFCEPVLFRLFVCPTRSSLIQRTPSHPSTPHPPQPLFISRINLDFISFFISFFFSFLNYFFSHLLALEFS